ncbi:MAG: hypothetical protein ACFB0E_03255 [Leptolyngbyaceae cyanobacterium]
MATISPRFFDDGSVGQFDRGVVAEIAAIASPPNHRDHRDLWSTARFAEESSGYRDNFQEIFYVLRSCFNPETHKPAIPLETFSVRTRFLMPLLQAKRLDSLTGVLVATLINEIQVD